MSSLKGLVLAFMYSLSSFGVIKIPSMEFLSTSNLGAKLDSFKFWDKLGLLPRVLASLGPKANPLRVSHGEQHSANSVQLITQYTNYETIRNN